MRERERIEDRARRLKAAAPPGLLGLVAGKVKTRDQILSTVVGVLIGLQVLKAEGILIGIGAVLAIGLGCGLLIRLWKWRVGVSRDSSDY